MDQLLVGAAGRVHVTFRDVDGKPVDPDTPGDVVATLTGVRSGEVFSDRPATRESVGLYTVTVVAGEIDGPDLLTVTWTGAEVGGLDATTVADVEALGAVLVTPALLAATLPSATIDAITATIAEVTDRIRKAQDWSFLPRLAVESVTTDSFGDADLTRRPVREVAAVTDLDGADVAHELLDPDMPRLCTRRPRTRLEVTYTYGADRPPHELREAAEVAARSIAHERSSGDVRRPRVAAGEGDRAFPLSTVSTPHRRPFGIDGVDDVVMNHDHHPIVGR